jgi:ubiquinone/menaquinone biosynthesis C-methylase UbiE
MCMSGSIDHPVFFYSRHPISLAIVLDRLRKARGGLEGLRPEELWPHDQDHYGGLAANDALAERAGLAPGARVADFCAGLGGPARYYAHLHGVDVTGIELTPARVAGAAELTRLVGLQDGVRVVQGDVTAVPLPDCSMDVVLSQEALLHVADKAQALAEALRILRPGGRLAFTDLTCHTPLADADAALMWEGMAIQTLQSLPGYRALLEATGFRIESIEDMTEEWGPILRQRLAMYQAMRLEAEAAGTPVGHDAFHRSYVRFVELILARQLGGIRATAVKP